MELIGRCTGHSAIPPSGALHIASVLSCGRNENLLAVLSSDNSWISLTLCLSVFFVEGTFFVLPGLCATH